MILINLILGLGHEINPKNFKPGESTILVKPFGEMNWIEAKVVKHHRDKTTNALISGQIQVKFIFLFVFSGITIFH